MMGNELEVTVITPEKRVFKDTASYVSLPAVEGVLGVLPGHTPLFTQIKQGEVSVKKGEETFHFSVVGGFVEVGKNKVTILADTVLRSEELDWEKIKEAKRKAEEKLQQKLSRQEYVTAEAELRKVLLDLRMAERGKLKKRNLVKANPLPGPP